MSKPEEQEELTVDFFDEVEDVVDDEEQLLDDEEEETKDEEEIEEEDSDDDSSEEDDKTSDEEDDDKKEEEEISEEDIPLVDSIKSKLGYEIEDKFEDSEEGIQLLVEKVSTAKADEVIERYFGEYPDVKELLEYRRLGGDSDKFFQTRFPEIDYSEVELNENDERQQEQVVRQELKEVRGYNNEEIEAELEDYKNGGILESKAKRALTALKSKQEKDRESLLEEQRKEDQNRQEQISNHWKQVKDTIQKSTSLHGLSISSKDKDDFFEYLSKPVEDGKSKAMKKAEEADLETRLAIDYLMYKGFNLSDLVDRKAKTKNAETLRKRLRKSKLDRKKQQESSDDYTEELGTI